MKRDIERRVDALELKTGGNGMPDIFITKYESQTHDEALALAASRREASGLPPLGPDVKVGFMVWSGL